MSTDFIIRCVHYSNKKLVLQDAFENSSLLKFLPYIFSVTVLNTLTPKYKLGRYRVCVVAIVTILMNAHN